MIQHEEKRSFNFVESFSILKFIFEGQTTIPEQVKKCLKKKRKHFSWLDSLLLLITTFLSRRKKKEEMTREFLEGTEEFEWEENFLPSDGVLRGCKNSWSLNHSCFKREEESKREERQERNLQHCCWWERSLWVGLELRPSDNLYSFNWSMDYLNQCFKTIRDEMSLSAGVTWCTWRWYKKEMKVMMMNNSNNRQFDKSDYPRDATGGSSLSGFFNCFRESLSSVTEMRRRKED